jgi:hypothetical protein
MAREFKPVRFLVMMALAAFTDGFNKTDRRQ